MLRRNLLLGSCFLIPLSSLLSTPMIRAQEIGFNERFALAEDREKALAELIPGTETFFYYHCLHCQTVGKLAEARGNLDAWVAKVGRNDQNERMLTRQLILEYKSNEQAALTHLKNQFGINTDHPAPRKDEAAELATSLDQNVLDWTALFRSYVNHLGNIENIAVGRAAPFLDEQVNLRSWIERIDRPDMVGLVNILERELKMQDSRGFGWAAIHNQLTNAQLIELQKRIPNLIESNAFVQARLRRIRPSDDRSLDDPAVIKEQLEALEAFVMTLPESQNSLKACVLYNRLAFDERAGNMDRARFIKYLELPNSRPFINTEFAKQQNRRPQINLGANYKSETTLDPIGDDAQLVRRYLEQFFQADANINAFSTYIDRDYLKRVFASTKILYGIGDAKTFYSQLSPDEQRELQSRVELNFAINNPKLYRPSDTVRLTIDLKNTPDLLVKIYRLNTRNILVQQKQPIATNIDLDGLVANVEKRLEYAQAADRRHREVLELPELNGGGAWVVDIMAGGLRSRTLISKGHLHAIQRLSNAGSVFRVFDADGNHVPTAKALFGTREFSAEEDGNIVIPFGRDTRQESLVLVDGPVASAQPFVQHAETYQLNAGFLVDPQSLLAGAKATVAIRPNLLCNGQLVSLGHIEKPELNIVTTDLDGIVSTQNFGDLELSDSSEFSKVFLVPQRLASISMTLSGKVLQHSNETRVPVSASYSVNVNESARTALIRDFYLTQTDKGYRLEVRGRNGEPAARIPVQLEFKLLGIVPTLSVRLATDDRGIVDLGELANVERFNATSDAIPQRSFALGQPNSPWPASYNCLKGESVEVVLSSAAGVQPIVMSPKTTDVDSGRYGLIEYRGGIVAASHAEKISVEKGLLTIQGLEPGSYRLTDFASGHSMQIAVVDGKEQGTMLVGQSRIVETNRVRPVHVQNVKVGNDKLEIQIGNHDRFTRVHVIADAFRPLNTQGLSFPAPELALTSAQRMQMPSFYINSLKLDEEYQYVLQRQFAKKYLGSLLPQPSAILNPWELSATQNTTQSAAAGDPMAAMSAPAPAPSSADALSADGSRLATNGLPDYEFLKRGSVMVLNGRCDDKGNLSLDRKALAGLSSVTVIVVHPSGTTYRVVTMPMDQDREYTDRRLAKAFPATDKLTELQSVRVLRGTGKQDLGDATSTRVKLYGSIADVFQLYKSLLPNNQQLDKFNCLTTWSTLKDEQKEVYYSDLACHELNLFLMVHDKPFFERVVKPYLSNKMQKQFMDDYVLGLDLSKYVKPWKLSQLNAVERVLLAKSLAQQTSPTKRWMSDLVGAITVDSAATTHRFETALMQNAMWDNGRSLGESVNGVWGAHGVRDTTLNGLEFENAPGSGGMGMGGGGMGGMGGSVAAADKSKFFMDTDADGLAEAESVKEEKQSDRPAAGKPASPKKKGSVNRAFGAERQMRGLSLGRSPKLYESLESTRKWAESNYFRLPIQNQSAELVKANAFWLDYLNHTGESLFLSEHIDSAATNVHEAVMAMAVIGLPLDSKPANMEVENGRLVVTNANDSIAFVKGLKSVEASSEPSVILASQNIFLANDPVETAKPVQGKPLVQGTVYRLRLVLTNPSASIVKVNVLQQIPQGSIGLENAKIVSGQQLDIAPFATQELTTKFYFPIAGDFSHYGAQIVIDGKLAIAAPSESLRVLANPDSVDESSWAYVSLWGTNAQVFEHLAKANLVKTNLDAIAWRMSDRKFYDQCLKQLSDYGVYNATLWAYSLKHNDAPRLREFLEKSDLIVERVGSVFNSDLMQVEPVDRLAFEHLDFRPLVVARTHQLGPKRLILNDGLAVQYNRMLTDLSYQKSIEAEQRLAIVYYMLLQNRTEEAVAHFAKIDPKTIESQLQHDYFAAYLDMVQGKFAEADARSQKYVTYPNPRWRDWFAQVRSQVAERKAIEAGTVTDVAATNEWKTDAANRILTGGREQQNQTEAAALPLLELIQDGDKLVLRHRNLEQVDINYYLMDVELLFSRNPFAQQDGGRLNSIEPNFASKLEFAKSATPKDLNVTLPENLKNKNVVIEVVGGGITRNLVIYANSLIVNMSPNMGRMQVLTKQGLKPLEGAYVKVYGRDASGAAKFYKDGYTDLRGQFDYVGLSTNDLDNTQRFSLLVLHPEHGTIVRETDPPKR